MHRVCWSCHLLLLPCTVPAAGPVTLFLATNTEGSIHLLLTSMLPPHLCECLRSCRVQRSRTLLCRLSRVTELSPSLLVFFFFYVVTAGGVTDWPIKHYLRIRVKGR